jgi:pSer/pThr/pTyr-binding forkhead associated (FHA) protein
MDIRLVLHKGKNRGQVCHLQHQQTLVGRRRECDLRILSAEVSRRHCLLSVQNGCVRVQDLDSSNGTFLNGKRVVGEQVIRPGDCLGIGSAEFIVEYELPGSPRKQLGQEADYPAALSEEAEVLPVREEAVLDDAVVVAGEAAEAEELPLADQDTELAPEEEEKSSTGSDPAASGEQPIPLAEDEARDWHLPQTNALRDLLSQMEEPQSRPRRRER